MNNTQKSRPIGIVPFSNSAVDILIPFHAQYEKVSELIKSIIVSVKSNPYQITLIDDCSDTKNFGETVKKEFLKSTPEGYRPQLQYIRSDERLGFGGALKLGFEKTNLPWVMFMHSDCVVEDSNFMLHMGQSLLNWKKLGMPVKMVSAKSDNPGDCQKAKAKFSERDEKDIVLDGETLPLFCSMCNRDLFNFIGGFIKSYPYAWYEDEELSHRMRKNGLLQGVSSKAWIKHHGGLTVNYVWGREPESKVAMEKNYELCMADIKRLK